MGQTTLVADLGDRNATKPSSSQEKRMLRRRLAAGLAVSLALGSTAVAQVAVNPNTAQIGCDSVTGLTCYLNASPTCLQGVPGQAQAMPEQVYTSAAQFAANGTFTSTTMTAPPWAGYLKCRVYDAQAATSETIQEGVTGSTQGAYTAGTALTLTAGTLNIIKADVTGGGAFILKVANGGTASSDAWAECSWAANP